MRRFVARQSELYSTPGSASSLISALRGYFWFRTACGDQMHALYGVLSYPANWQLASLPKALSAAEIKRLVDSLGHEGPSARRADNAEFGIIGIWALHLPGVPPRQVVEAVRIGPKQGI